MFKKGFLFLIPLLAAAGPIALFSASGWWSQVTASVSPSGASQKQEGLAIYPGLCITLAVVGLNLFGDGLRDISDPRR